MNKYCYVFISLVLLGCGQNKSTKGDVNTPEIDSIGSAPILPSALRSPDQECALKKADFELIEGSCVEKPNVLLNGEMNKTTGTIWEPNIDNCTKIYNEGAENQATFYQRCAGFEVNIPLTKPSNGSALNRVRISYQCPMDVEFPLEIKTDSTQAFVAPKKDGTDVFSQTLPVNASENVVVTLKLIPDYKKISGANYVAFPETCRVILVENSIVPGS